MPNQNKQVSAHLGIFLVAICFWTGLLALRPIQSHASALSDLITSMEAGTWAELKTSSFPSTDLPTYQDSGVWDSINRKFYYCGSNHGASLNCRGYNDATNSWSALPAPFGGTTYHAYDAQAFNQGDGKWYFREQSSNLVYRYTPATNSWASAPSIPSASNCCSSLVYFPEYNGGGLIFHHSENSSLYFLPDGGSTWQVVPNSSSVAGGGTWNFAEYNPVHKVVLFGGSSLGKMTAAGVVSRINNNMPFGIYDGTGWAGHVTVDPVTGDYLVLTPGMSGQRFYKYDINTQVWTQIANPPSGLTGAIVVAPLSNYGATMWLSCGTNSGACTGRTFIYKHASSSGPVSTPKPTVNITANPTTVSAGSSTTLSWSSSNATLCTASGGWSGNEALNGSQITGIITATTTFTLTCTGSGGVTSQSATVTISSPTSSPTSVDAPTLLVKFGPTNSTNSFGLSGWSTVIKDIYTDNRNFGPGGMTVVTGNNASYNYQGVTGTTRTFLVGEKIRVTWYNNSASAVTFSPNISFTSQSRISNTAGWHSMTSVTIPPFGTATSEYALTSSSTGSYSSVNVNANYSNNQIVVLNKIELLPVESSPPPTTSFDFLLVNGGNKSVVQGQTLSNNISATLASGTAQAVAFSTTGLPSGAVYTFSVTSCTPTCSTNMSITTTAGTPTGTYPITVTASGGNLTKTTAFTLTVTATTTTPPSTSTSADADFAARCTAPAVVVCQPFNTMGAVGSDLVRFDVSTSQANILPRNDGQYRATVDTSVKKSGAGSLKFILDAGHAAANIAGQYLPQQNNGLGSGFGENTTWYVQFAVRFSPEYFSNQINYWDSTPKIAIFHMNSQSCAGKELTTNQYFSSGILSGYKDCGGNGFRTELDGFTFKPTSNGTPYLFQQGDHACAYPGTGNCFTLPSNKWITLYYKIHNGNWGVNNSTMEAWYSVDGQPYVKWLNLLSNFTIECNGASPCPGETFNNITLTPYMTALSRSAPVNAYVWYDELIVSRQPIPAPGNSPSPVSPPASPTSLTLK